MRIDEIASSAEYRMDKQSHNLPIFLAKLWIPELEENSINLLILQFENSSNFNY